MSLGASPNASMPTWPTRAFVQDIFTFREAEPAPRTDNYNFETMPLWHFVLLAIGAAIAGDVELKLMYAMIG